MLYVLAVICIVSTVLESIEDFIYIHKLNKVAKSVRYMLDNAIRNTNNAQYFRLKLERCCIIIMPIWFDVLILLFDGYMCYKYLIVDKSKAVGGIFLIACLFGVLAIITKISMLF